MTELAVYQTQSAEMVVPVAHSFDNWIPVLQEVVGLAEAIHASPFVPEGLRGSVPAVAAAILTGRELGIPPMTALANIHLIKGKTGLSALLMRALIQSKGHQWEDVRVTDTQVVIRGRRRGESEWTEAAFDADQAKRAGITLNPYPQDKLYARASVRLARRKFADVIAGMPYSAEELEDGVIEEQSETTQPASAAETPKPRTAQRRAAKPAAEVTPPEPPSEKSPQPPPQASNLPPLPGEDEPGEDDYDTPGTVTGPQLTKIAVLMGELGFTQKQRDDKLKLAGRIVNRDLESSKDLSKREAGALIETIERCDTDYDKLTVLLDAGDKPDE